MNRILLSFCAAGCLVLAGLGASFQAQGDTGARIVQDEEKGVIKSFEFESKHLPKKRNIRVYLPPGHDPKKTYPVVYSADGLSNFSAKLVEPLIHAKKIPPVVVVGMASSNKRQEEYIPGWTKTSMPVFEAHEKFFIEEVMPWAEKEFGASKERKDRAIYGSSNSGPFALCIPNRHPNLFGHVFAMMVYGLKYNEFTPGLKEQPKDPTRYILVSGSLDKTGVSENAKIEKILKEKNLPVSIFVIEGGGHTNQLNQQQLPMMLEMSFGKKQDEPAPKEDK